MFVIRRAKIEDVGTLLKLARMVHFINLPPDQQIITEKITHSRNCFVRAAAGECRYGDLARTKSGGLASNIHASDLFMFAMEDTESGGMIGTSQLVAKMGGEDRPNYTLKLEKRDFFAEDIHTGTTHTVARLHSDASGPTELGGLILQPSFRGHKLKLGRFLSMVRFHFIGLHRAAFAGDLLAEMMAEITPDGRNTFWEYFGRRFIPLSYDEADRHCQISREFISSLLPHDDIYLTLLPPHARDSVGKVGAETVPARRMLEKLGFRYNNFVDPFDGGPHLHAVTDEITPVRETVRLKLGEGLPKARLNRRGIVSLLDTDGEFLAVEDSFSLATDGTLRIGKATMKVLRASPDDEVGVTPTDGLGPVDVAAKIGSKRAGGPKPSPKKPAPATPRKRKVSAAPGSEAGS
ncbi:MAG: arginine N-succinyltransferase [Phycisphaerales bacterium]|nr:arginine N-succinyltransferase [Phycisphaerales bacterium]